MIRNIIKSTFVACVLAFSLGSCENDFDAKIYGKLSTTNFPATAADYESYLMDCYNHRAPQEIWGYMYHENGRIYHKPWDRVLEDVMAHSFAQ